MKKMMPLECKYWNSKEIVDAPKGLYFIHDLHGGWLENLRPLALVKWNFEQGNIFEAYGPIPQPSQRLVKE